MRTRWKTTLALAIMVAASFTVGAMANQVIVQQIQSLAGNHVLVPAPELQIISSTFTINGTLSVITAVILNVTTVGQPGAPVVTKLYQVFIQVSCLAVDGREFTCATGAATITLPSSGGSGRLVVPIAPQIDPELVEVHDLSFIVTGTPSPVSGGCTADFAISAVPTSVTLNETGTGRANATLTKILTSICQFSGTINLSTKLLMPVPGLTASLFPATVTLTPGGTALVTEVITAVGVPPGSYPILNVATSGGSLFHSVQVTANVINTPPPCTPGFTITTNPPQVFLNRTFNPRANVTKIITSNCGFSGTVSLTAASSPPGLTVVLSTTSVTINPQLSAVVTETIVASTTTAPGLYNVTNTGISGAITAIGIVKVQVV